MSPQRGQAGSPLQRCCSMNSTAAPSSAQAFGICSVISDRPVPTLRFAMNYYTSRKALCQVLYWALFALAPSLMQPQTVQIQAQQKANGAAQGQRTAAKKQAKGAN